MDVKCLNMIILPVKMKYLKAKNIEIAHGWEMDLLKVNLVEGVAQS